MNTITSVVNRHGIEINVGDTIRRGNGEHQVESVVSELIEQRNLHGEGTYIAADFGPKPKSNLERWGYNRFENVDHIKNK